MSNAAISPGTRVSAGNASILTKWKVDFTSKQNRIVPIDSVSSSNIVPPPGYTTGAAHVAEVGSQDDDHRLMAKRSWEVALGPIKQVPMQLFMMYMAGNSISIFPIMMVGMMLVRPFKMLMAINSTFATLESPGSSLLYHKFVFALGNMACVAVALYKCSSMGLLPTHSSDWLAFVDPQERMEFAGGGAMMS